MSVESLSQIFTNKMNDFDKRLELATNKSGSPSELKILREDFTAFKAKITADLCALQDHVAHLDLRVDSIDAASRKRLLLLHGVKEEVNENTRSLVSTVLSGLGCPEDAIQGIECSKRLGRPKPGKNRPILLEFLRQTDRRSIWEKKRGLKNSALLLTESLTPVRQKLFSSIRSIFSPHKCWTSDGTIVVLLPDGSKRAINSQKQLDAAAALLSRAKVPLHDSNSSAPDTQTKPPVVQSTSTSSLSSNSGHSSLNDGSRSIGLRSKTNAKK